MTTTNRLSSVGTVATASLLVISGSLPLALVAAFAVRIKASLLISDAQIGLVVSTFFAASMIVAIPAGRLADKLGPSRSAALGAGLGGIALVGVATVVDSYPMLLLMFVVGGAGQSIASPASNVLIAGGVQPERLGISMGIKQSSVPSASLVAGALVAATALSGAWRWPFALAATIPVIALLLARIIARIPWSAETTASVPPTATMKRMWRFVLGALLSNFSASAVIGFLVLGLVDFGVIESTAGVLLSVAGMTAVGVRISSGYLKDRLQFSSGNGVVVLLLVGVVGFLMMVSSVPVLVPIGGVVAFGAGWGWPAMFQMSLIEMHPDAAGAATGIARIGLAGGHTIGSVAFGLLFENFGYRTGWLVASGTMTAAALMFSTAYVHARKQSVT